MMMMRLVTGPPRLTIVRAGCDGPPGRPVAHPTYTVVDPAARRTAGRTSHTRRNDYSRARASLCRVRDEHASRTDEHPGPALAVRRDRVAAGLASDLLRGGPHLGGGGRHGRRGPLVPRVRGALRRPGGGRPRHGPLGGHRPHAGPQDPGPRGPPPHRAGGAPGRRAGVGVRGAHPGARRGRRHGPRLAVRDGRVRARPAVGALPGAARRRGRGREHAGVVRPRPAHPELTPRGPRRLTCRRSYPPPTPPVPPPRRSAARAGATTTRSPSCSAPAGRRWWPG